jgi:Domain of unknown function (DUF4388)
MVWLIEEELTIARSGYMFQQQAMITDHLVHVISSIQRGRRSGVLTAQRGGGILLEEGTIVFTNGQVSQVTVGRRRGSEALNWLSTWQSCYYTFVPTEAGVQANQSSLSAKDSSTSPSAPGPPPNMTDTRLSVQQTPTSSFFEGQEGLTDAPATAAPYPTQQLDTALRLIEQHRLSRTHRQLFYLVDGHRSMVDLVRLTGKRGSEISKLLGDLERIQVIRIK